MADSAPDRWRILSLSPTLSARWRYGGAVLLSLLFMGCRWGFAHFVIDDRFPFEWLFIPVALSAFFGGFGPGLVSVLITVSLTDYMFIPPLYTVGFSDPRTVVGTILFSISGMLVSVLGEASRRAVFRASTETDLRKAAQRQSHEAEERLRIAEQVIAGGVWDWDVSRGNVYWSDGFQRLCDFPLDQHPSYELWLETLHPEDRGQVTADLQELFHHRLHNWSREYRIRTANGRTRWVSSRGQVFYDAWGKPRRMVGIAFDITAQHLLDSKAARLSETG
jgi:PAS domain S-box-containing protein